MPVSKGSDLNKTWISQGRGTNNYSANSNIAIAYGRYLGTVSGLGAPGNSPTAATYTINYNTNYNVAYPIANQPEAARPATAWTTNYSTNYNIAYPIANQPEAARPVTAWTTNYNVAYPIANRPEAARPATAWTTNYNVAYPIANRPIGNQPATAFNPTKYQFNWQANVYGFFTNGATYSFPFWNFETNPPAYYCPQGQYIVQNTYNKWPAPTPNLSIYYLIYYCVTTPGNAKAWTTNYNTNYNVAYPIANQPATAWTINYNTNYNVAYPIANQPIANQPINAWTINYNTNYNVAYPIANQPEAARPVTSYNPATAGTPFTVLGVPFPGGAKGNVIDGGPTAKPVVNPTVVNYWDYPDNTTYPVTVYSGANVTIQIE